MADGKSCGNVETVLLALETDDGRAGWGEVCPIPHCLPAYARGAPALQEMAPVLLGADPVGTEAVMARIAREAWAGGITRFQVKLGADGDGQADVARLRLVREAVGGGALV